MVFTFTLMQVWKDGVLSSTVVPTNQGAIAAFADDTMPWTLGSEGSVTGRVMQVGALNHIRMWGRALSATEAVAVYSRPLVKPSTLDWISGALVFQIGFAYSQVNSRVEVGDHMLPPGSWTINGATYPILMSAPAGCNTPGCMVQLIGATAIAADPCMSTPCFNGGTCTSTAGFIAAASFYCECPVGTTGKFCQTNINECASNPCTFGSSCVDGLNKFTCVPWCTSQPCPGSGECTPFPENGGRWCGCALPTVANGYRLVHGLNWWGRDLASNAPAKDDPIACADYCATVPGATLSLNNGFLCYCKRWWNVDFLTSDGSCTAAPVNITTVVKNVPQQFTVTLSCKPGYIPTSTLNSTCMSDYTWSSPLADCDLNECMTSNGGCVNGATCTNTIGSRSCACASGFTGAACDQDINECAVNSGGCDHGTCTNGFGYYTCTCQSGWSQIGIGACSIDVNECASNNGGCGAATSWNCTNTPGSFQCSPICAAGTLPDGFGGCADINECATASGGCQNFGACQNTFGSHTCDCTGTGYTGPTCGTDVNECATGNGGCVHGACQNLPATFQCNCDPYWTGFACATDINECTASNGGCIHGGLCVNVAGGPNTCNCAGTGFMGVICNIDVNECATSNGGCTGSCTNVAGSFTCDSCSAGYSGVNCDDINECATTNGGCVNGGACVNSPGSHSCNCAGTGFTDPTCSTPLCAASNGGCLNGATCSVVSGAVSCACVSGYTGNSCESDINECAIGTSGCDANAVCTNTPGSRTCVCASGYSGTGLTCSDINECLTSNGLCDPVANCTNTLGSRTCACPPYYTGNGVTCTAINECVSTPGICQNGGSCSQPAGQPRLCSCASGWIGSECQTDINECASVGSGCDANAVCANTPGSRTCTCNGGYTGSGLSCTDINECAASNGGCSSSPLVACTNTPGSRTCDPCPSGYSGSGVGACSDINECVTNNGLCDPLATCLNTPGSRTCACPAYYAGNGVTCTAINECVSTPGVCQNGGTCSQPAGQPRSCTCATGWTDGDCQTDINECATNNGGGCDTNAVCNNTPGSRTCTCRSGYSGNGVTCSEVNECASNNGGCSTAPLVTCTNTVGSRTCATCPTGYTGTGVGQCADINECAASNGGCLNGARCQNLPGTLACQCALGFSGSTCATVVTTATVASTSAAWPIDSLSYYQFSPSADSRYMPSSSFTAGWTVEFWFYAPNNMSDTNTILSRNRASMGTGFAMGVGMYREILTSYWNSVQLFSYSSSPHDFVLPNGWHHYMQVVSSDLSTVQYWRDGVFQISSVVLYPGFPPRQVQSSMPWTLGSEGSVFTRIMRGTALNHLRVWAYPLSTAELSRLYTLPIVTPASADWLTATAIIQAGFAYSPVSRRVEVGDPSLTANGYSWSVANGDPNVTSALSPIEACATPGCMLTCVGSACNTGACASSPCQNGGRCVNPTAILPNVASTYQCQCAPGFTGANCQFGSPCDPAPCANGGVCAATPGVGDGYQCTCASGWSGATCAVNINECASSPCRYGGTCVDAVNGYACHCLSTATYSIDGPNCENVNVGGGGGTGVADGSSGSAGGGGVQVNLYFAGTLSSIATFLQQLLSLISTLFTVSPGRLTVVSITIVVLPDPSAVAPATQARTRTIPVQWSTLSEIVLTAATGTNGFGTTLGIAEGGPGEPSASYIADEIVKHDFSADSAQFVDGVTISASQKPTRQCYDGSFATTCPDPSTTQPTNDGTAGLSGAVTGAVVVVVLIAFGAGLAVCYFKRYQIFGAGAPAPAVELPKAATTTTPSPVAAVAAAPAGDTAISVNLTPVATGTGAPTVASSSSSSDFTAVVAVRPESAIPISPQPQPQAAGRGAETELVSLTFAPVSVPTVSGTIPGAEAVHSHGQF